MIETLQQGHHLCHEALKQLSMAIYDWHEEDFARLVETLKQGKWGNQGKKWTDKEINDANFTSKFKERFDTYPPKRTHPESVIVHKLEV